MVNSNFTIDYNRIRYLDDDLQISYLDEDGNFIIIKSYSTETQVPVAARSKA